MANQTVSNSGRGQGFKGTGNLLQDLLSSSVSINKLKLSSLPKNKTFSTVLESEDENKGLTLFTSSCSVCFSDKERVEVIKEAEVDILKKVVFKSWTNVTPTGGLGFNWICTHCSATLERLAKCRHEIEDIVTYLQSVIRIQIATGQRANLIHESNGAVRDVPRLSMATTARVSLAKNEASNPKCAPVSEYNAQESVGLDYNVFGNILEDEGDTDTWEGINTSHLEDESEDKSIWVPIHVKEVEIAKLGEDPLDLTNWQVIEQAPLMTNKPKTKQTIFPCTCPNCTGINARNKGKTNKQHLCHIPGCGKVYSKITYLRNHLRRHSPEKPFMCHFLRCDECFTTSDDLENHRKTHTGEKPFLCRWPHCGKWFTSSSVLKRHRRSHTGETPFECPWPLCSKRFTRLDLLKQHTKIHTGEKPFLCHWLNCGRSFKTSDELQNHRQIHTAEKPFVCRWPHCGKSFTRSDILLRHRRSHTGEKPFVCQWPRCSKSFTRADVLKQHTAIHTGGGQTPFVCHWPHCGKRFAKSDFLQNHRETHIEEGGFQGPECPENISRSARLSTHIKTRRIVTEDAGECQSHYDEDLKHVVMSIEIDTMDKESINFPNCYGDMENGEQESTMAEDWS